MYIKTRAFEVLEKIYKEGNYTFANDNYNLQYLYLDSYLLEIKILDTTLLVSCSLYTFSEDEDDLILLEKLCSLTKSIYLDHKINTCLKDNKFCVEININCEDLDIDKCIAVFTNYVNDLDLFNNFIEQNTKSTESFIYIDI